MCVLCLYLLLTVYFISCWSRGTNVRAKSYGTMEGGQSCIETCPPTSRTLAADSALAASRSTGRHRSQISLWHAGKLSTGRATSAMPKAQPHQDLHSRGCCGYPTATLWHLLRMLITYVTAASMRSHAAGTEASGDTTAGTGAGGGELATVVRHTCNARKPISITENLSV